MKNLHYSEACGPPQFQEKRSQSDKAILGALREFRGILGATLAIQKVILGMRNSILRMASHDLSNTETTILGATLGAIPGIGGSDSRNWWEAKRNISFAPAFSERLFKNWGGPRAQELYIRDVQAPLNRSCVPNFPPLGSSNPCVRWSVRDIWQCQSRTCTDCTLHAFTYAVLDSLQNILFRVNIIPSHTDADGKISKKFLLQPSSSD